MAKAQAARTQHRCQGCGHTESRWHGRCPGCGEWNSMVEEAAAGASAPRGLSAERTAAHLPGAGGRPVSLAAVETEDRAPRVKSGIGEFDRVLGGGLVAGSMV